MTIGYKRKLQRIKRRIKRIKNSLKFITIKNIKMIDNDNIILYKQMDYVLGLWLNRTICDDDIYDLIDLVNIGKCKLVDLNDYVTIFDIKLRVDKKQNKKVLFCDDKIIYDELTELIL